MRARCPVRWQQRSNRHCRSRSCSCSNTLSRKAETSLTTSHARLFPARLPSHTHSGSSPAASTHTAATAALPAQLTPDPLVKTTPSWQTDSGADTFFRTCRNVSCPSSASGGLTLPPVPPFCPSSSSAHSFLFRFGIAVSNLRDDSWLGGEATKRLTFHPSRTIFLACAKCAIHVIVTNRSDLIER